MRGRRVRHASGRGHRSRAGLERIAAVWRGARVCRRRVAWACAGPRACRLGAGGARAGCTQRIKGVMGRVDSLAKLAWAYGLHLTRRRLTQPKSQLTTLLDTYGPDGMRALQPSERALHPRLTGCINCGVSYIWGSGVGRMVQARMADIGVSDRLL